MGAIPYREPSKPTTTGDAATETAPTQTDRGPYRSHKAVGQDSPTAEARTQLETKKQ